MVNCSQLGERFFKYTVNVLSIVSDLHIYTVEYLLTLAESYQNRGYYLENGVEGSVAGDCLSDVSSGMTLTFALTTPGRSDTWNTATTTLTDSSTVGAIAVVGWNIRVEWSTSSTFSSSSAPFISSIPSPSSSASSTLVQSSTLTHKFQTTTPSQFSPTTSGTQSVTESSSPSGITTSTAIGIGVGVGLGVVGIAALVVAACLMRRRKRGMASASMVENKQEPSSTLHAPTQNMVHELHPEDIRLELSASHAPRTPAELYG